MIIPGLGGEIQPVVESIDDIQIVLAEIQAGAEVGLTGVDQHPARLAIDDEQVEVVRAKVDLGRGDRDEPPTLGRARPSRYPRWPGRVRLKFPAVLMT